MNIDWVEASKILLTAFASAVYIGIFAFAAQKITYRYQQLALLISPTASKFSK